MGYITKIANCDKCKKAIKNAATAEKIGDDYYHRSCASKVYKEKYKIN
jgi:hypothetical protein